MVWSSLLGGLYRHTHQLSQSAVCAAAAVEDPTKVRAWHADRQCRQTDNADRQSVRERRGVGAEQPAPLIAAHWSQRQYIAAGQSVDRWHRFIAKLGISLIRDLLLCRWHQVGIL